MSAQLVNVANARIHAEVLCMESNFKKPNKQSYVIVNQFLRNINRVGTVLAKTLCDIVRHLGVALKLNGSNTVKILFADDETIIHRGMTHLLDILQLEVVCVDNAEAALEMIQTQHFDLLISDIQMPRMDGFALTKAVHALKSDIPIILLTGFLSPEIDERAIEAGVRKVLRKPFKFGNLREIIQEVENEIINKTVQETKA